MLIIYYVVIRFGLVWLSMVWFGLVWFGLVWFGLVWFCFGCGAISLVIACSFNYFSYYFIVRLTILKFNYSQNLFYAQP